MKQTDLQTKLESIPRKLNRSTMPFQTLEGAASRRRRRRGTRRGNRTSDEHTQTIKERGREKGENMWNSERGEKLEQKESTEEKHEMK